MLELSSHIRHSWNPLRLSSRRGPLLSRPLCTCVMNAAGAPLPLLMPAVSLDVEYGHWRSKIGQEITVAAWLAVVNESGSLVLDTHIEQESQVCGHCWCNGAEQP